MKPRLTTARMNTALSSRVTWLILAALIVAVLVPLPLSRYGIYLAALTLIYAIAAHGLNLTIGYAGQISLGHAAFFGIGAYVGGLLMVKLGVSFWLAVPIAAAGGCAWVWLLRMNPYSAKIQLVEAASA